MTPACLPVLPASPLPRRSRQPLAFSTLSMHSGNPYEFTSRSFAVSPMVLIRLARRTATGSSLSSRAIMSSRLSNANRTLTVPWPRNAPFGGVLVSTRKPWYFTACKS